MINLKAMLKFFRKFKVVFIYVLFIGFIIIFLTTCNNGITNSNYYRTKEWIAFTEYFQDRDTLHSTIQIFDINGDNHETIIEDKFYFNNIEWMNDKPEIIFSGSDWQAGNFFIKSYNLNSRKIQTLWENDSSNFDYIITEISISNENKIAFYLKNIYETGFGNICTINRDGTDFKKLNNINAYKMKYIDNQIYFIENNEIAVVNDDGTKYKKIINLEIDYLSYYSISPNIENIVFPSNHVNFEKNVLYQTDINGNDLEIIFNLDSASLSKKGYKEIRDVIFSSDGSKILFGQKSSILTVIDSKTYEYVQIDTKIPSNIYYPILVDNNEKIIFRSNKNEEFYLYRIDANGEKLKQLVMLENRLGWSMFSVSPRYD